MGLARVEVDCMYVWNGNKGLSDLVFDVVALGQIVHHTEWVWYVCQWSKMAHQNQINELIDIFWDMFANEFKGFELIFII
jgi:hypothetical protein